MIKKIICAACAVSIMLSGCGKAEQEEYVFSLSKEQQENYADIIEETLNSFYWHYDGTSLAYNESKVPENTEANADIFEASAQSGYDMTRYAGRDAVCYTANLYHINSQKAGIVYFYFIKDDIVGLYYSPDVNPQKVVALNIRNVFTPSAGITKTESDSPYSGSYSTKKLSILSEGFESLYKYEGGSYLLELTESSINIYRFSAGTLRRYRTISYSQLGYKKPISATFLNDGSVAVIVGSVAESYEGAENERIYSEKVLFFNSNFSKESTEIELASGSYSSVAAANNGLVIINDKNTEFYKSEGGQYVKEHSYYINVQATDFKQVDIDGDSVNEYIITDEKDLYIYKQTKSGLDCIWRTNVSSECYYGYIYTADLNNDGADEIYICDNTGTVIRYVIGKDGLVSRNDDILYSQRIYAGDFNNDGKDDYILADSESCTLYVRQ